MWWVEGRGYQEERRLHHKIREAKEKLQWVLKHYGFDEEVPQTLVYKKVTCPFHDDRHPSATVNGRYFRCFACGVKGSAIDLVMEEENLSFVEAVNFIERL